MKRLLSLVYLLTAALCFGQAPSVRYNGAQGRMTEPVNLHVGAGAGKTVTIDSGGNLVILSGGTITVNTGATITFPAGFISWASVSKTGSSLADLTTRSASDLSSGTLPDARFPATLPALSGINLTALNAGNLGSGTVPTARLYTTAVGYNITNGSQIDAWGLKVNPSGVVVGTTDSQTLTNKSIAWSEVNSGVPTTAVGYNITNGAAIDALGAVASNGLLQRTAANTYSVATYTGLTWTTGVLSVNAAQAITSISGLTSNGPVYTTGGVGTLNVGSTTGSGTVYVLATAPAIVGGSHTALTGLGIRTTGAAFDLTFASSEVLTAGRTLSIVMGDAARTLTLFGSTTIPVVSQQITVSGPTAARTWTVPDASFTLARTDAANTFTGAQTFLSTAESQVGLRLSSATQPYVLFTAPGWSGNAQAYIEADVNIATSSTGDYLGENIPTGKGYSWAINASSQMSLVSTGLTVSAATAATSTSSGAFIVNNVFSVGGATGNVFAAGVTHANGGITSPGAGTNSEVFGVSATVSTADSCLAIGDSSAATTADDIAIGRTASATGGRSIAIGNAATTSGTNYSIALGYSSHANAGVAIGGGAQATAGAIVISAQFGQVAAFSGLWASNGNNDFEVYLGAGGPSGGAAAAYLSRIHGVQPSSGSNGGTLYLAGGKGGAATDTGGPVIIQTAPSASGTTLATVATFGADKSTTLTGILVLPASGSVQQSGTISSVGALRLSASQVGVGWKNAGGTANITISTDGSDNILFNNGTAIGYFNTAGLVMQTGVIDTSTSTDLVLKRAGTTGLTIGASLVVTHASTVSGTSTTAASILGKSMGLTENLYVGGVGNFAGTATIGVGTANARQQTTIFEDYTYNVAFGNGQLAIRGATTQSKGLFLGMDTTNNVGLIEAGNEGVAVLPVVIQANGGNVYFGAVAPSSVQTRVGVYVDSGPNSSLAGQFSVNGLTAPTKCTTLGFDTTNNFGYLYAGVRGSNYSPLVLQPSPSNENVYIGANTNHSSEKLQVTGTAYVSSNITSGGSVSTGDPTNGSGVWKLGKVRTSVAAAQSTTSVLEVSVDGTRYDILVATALF